VDGRPNRRNKAAFSNSSGVVWTRPKKNFPPGGQTRRIKSSSSCKICHMHFENEFDLHENKRVGGILFHMNGFARKLLLKQRMAYVASRGSRVYRLKWLVGRQLTIFGGFLSCPELTKIVFFFFCRMTS